MTRYSQPNLRRCVRVIGGQTGLVIRGQTGLTLCKLERQGKAMFPWRRNQLPLRSKSMNADMGTAFRKLRRFIVEMTS